MTKKTTEEDVPKDDPEQSKRFIEKALQLESDESGTTFEKAMGAIAKKPGNSRN